MSACPMRRWLTGDDLFAWMLMLRLTDERAFLVVEGPTDCEALDSHIDHTSALYFAAHSKSVVKRAVLLAEEQELTKVLGVLDRDWVGLLEQPVCSPNFVYTDDYDLDATIFFAGTILERVVASHSSREARDAQLGPLEMSVRDVVTRCAGVIGVLRHAAERDGMSLDLSAFPVHEVLVPAQADIDMDALILIAVRRSKHAATTEREAREALDKDLASASELRRYCNGHDLAAALSAFISHWGAKASKVVLERAARGALSCDELRTTSLFTAVTTWAASNQARIWAC